LCGFLVDTSDVEATSAPRTPALRIPKPRRLLAALSDERLVEQVRRGEVVAFEVLYDRYSTGILGFCRHMLGSQSDAEDATQQTFMSAHADIQRHGRRNLHVKAWLYTIARNRCLSTLRARREQVADNDLDLATDTFVRDVEDRAEIRALLGDIAKLPDDQREALVLAEVGDLSHSDISEVLGCEVSKVKSLVFQARTGLIDRRIARETPCAEIREQLATLRGGALRRSHLRQHLEACPGCTEYREQIRRQRAMLALALPVVPSAALRAKVLGGLGLGSGTAAAGGAAATATGGGLAATATGGGLGLTGSSGVAAKLGLVAVLAAGGAGGATVATGGAIPLIHPAPAAHEASQHSAGKVAHTVVHTVTKAAGKSAVAPGHTKTHRNKSTGSHRSARGSERGFTPITGQSNGAQARAFAQTRGKGAERSATRRHVKAKRSHPVKPVRAKQVPPVRTQVTPSPKSNTRTPTQTTTAPETTTPQTTEPAPAPPPSGNGKSLLNGAAGKTKATAGTSAG
jgi:RNA polymerase sigma factor (sigma-70 family)